MLTAAAIIGALSIIMANVDFDQVAAEQRALELEAREYEIRWQMEHQQAQTNNSTIILVNGKADRESMADGEMKTLRPRYTDRK